jgi:hypothetical protein
MTINEKEKETLEQVSVLLETLLMGKTVTPYEARLLWNKLFIMMNESKEVKDGHS